MTKNEYKSQPAFYSIFATIAKVESLKVENGKENSDKSWKIFIPGKLSIGHSSTVFSDFYEISLTNLSFPESNFASLWHQKATASITNTYLNKTKINSFQ